MANDQETEIDFDNMSDEDFLKLGEPSASDVIEGTQEGEEDEVSNEDATEAVEGADVSDESQDDTENESESDDEQEEEETQQKNTAQEAEQDTSDESTETSTQDTVQDDEQSTTDAKEEEKSSTEDVKDKDKPKVKSDLTQTQVDEAVNFYKRITAPFKADGKDFTVRSPEDAIRLMQQGVNYSRRMQEIKPVKVLNRMLVDHGLNDETKLSFMIDVLKGDKVAITKLLKDTNIDPIDLDTSTEVSYQTKSYASNPKETAFRDALDTTMAIPEGKALVSEIHNTWDDASKQQLQENPAVLGNLTELKRIGVYEKIEQELAYQRNLGYLTDIPYLQAFDLVGEEMKKAGVFGSQPSTAPKNKTEMGQLSNNTQMPVKQGVRKEPAKKKAAPNPIISSNPASKKTVVKDTTPDFGDLSDEEFLKLAPPK